MRSFILTCFLVLCLCAAASAETKIGFVDMQAVIAKSEPGLKAMEQLKSQFKGMKNNLGCLSRRHLFCCRRQAEED